MNNNFMCFPHGKTKALTFSFDDGNRNDKRLIELFNKYGVKGTFNLNSGIMNGGNENLLLEEISEVYKGHEVAVHTVNHPFLEKLPTCVAQREVLEDRLTLEKYTGYVVRGMAYPFGTYNDDVVRVCRDAGIKYSRTVEAHHSFKLPEDWLRMPSTCHQEDGEIFNLAEKFIKESPTDRRFCTDSWLFYIWGHSYEYRTEADWDRMENLVSYLAHNENVWYATNIEIYDYIESYRHLEFSADFNRVYNPSSITVWLKHPHDGRVYCVKGGEEVDLSK